MIRYEIDTEKRTVTAKLTGCKLNVVNALNRKFGGAIVAENTKLYKDALMQDEFTGVARCHPDDTFDVDFGRKLAKQRMMLKHHKAKLRALEAVQKDFVRMIAVVVKMEDHEDAMITSSGT